MKTLLTIILVALSNQMFSQLDYEQYKGEESKVSFDKVYRYAYLYDYAINSKKKDSILSTKLEITIPEGLLTEEYSQKLLGNLDETTSFEILLKSKLIIDIGTDRFYFIKYDTRLDGTLSENQIFTAEKKDGSWKKSVNESAEIEMLKEILQLATVDALFEFNNLNDNKQYPEINAFKPRIKNEFGVMNIKNLRELIAEKPAIFK